MLVNKLLKGSVKTLAFLTRTSIIMIRRFSDNTSIKQPRKTRFTFLSAKKTFVRQRGFFMSKNNFSTYHLARAGIIAGLYVAVSFIIAPFASGAIQVRLSEGLTILAIILPESIPALFVGCLLSNLITGCAIYDVIFGSLITLISAIFSYFSTKRIKKTPLKIFIGGLFPILFNAFLLPLIWQWCYGFGQYVYIVQVAFLLIGQTISVYAIGTPIYLTVKRLKEKNLKFLQ